MQFLYATFTDTDASAVLAANKDDAAYAVGNTTSPIVFSESKEILKGDKVFFLSAEEADNPDYGFVSPDSRQVDFNAAPAPWGLRSPVSGSDNYVGLIKDDGEIGVTGITDDFSAGLPSTWIFLKSSLQLSRDLTSFPETRVCFRKQEKSTALRERTGNWP